MAQQLQVFKDPSVVAPRGATFTEQFYTKAFPAAPQTVAVDPFTGNPVNATPSGNTATRAAMTQKQQSGGATYYDQPGGYGYNSQTGEYELKQPGNAYTVGPYKPNADFSVRNPAAAAIQKAVPIEITVPYGRAAPPLPRPRPGYAPSRIDMAAINGRPSFGSATLGGLSFNAKFGNAYRTAALHQQVGLAPQQTANPQVAAAMAARPASAVPAGTVQSAANGYIYTADGRGNWVQTGKVNPALTPSQQYAAAAASAHDPNAGYTPSSSGVSGDYFSTIRSGGSYGS